MNRFPLIVFIILGVLVPAGLVWQKQSAWAAGFLAGEVVGAVNLLWRVVSLRGALSQTHPEKRRTWMWHSTGRIVLVGAVAVLAIRWPALSVWGFLVGFLVWQLPGAVLYVALRSKPDPARMKP